MAGLSIRQTGDGQRQRQQPHELIDLLLLTIHALSAHDISPLPRKCDESLLILCTVLGPLSTIFSQHAFGGRNAGCAWIDLDCLAQRPCHGLEDALENVM